MATRKKTSSYPSLEPRSPEKMTPRERRLSKIVEFQLSITPRGRSVITGSLLVEGKIQSFKHELDHEEKVLFLDQLVYILKISDE